MLNMSLATAGALVVYDSSGGGSDFTVHSGVALVLDGHLNVCLDRFRHNQLMSICFNTFLGAG